MTNKFSFSSLINSVSKFVTEQQVIEKKQTPQQKAHQLEIENSILVLAAEVIRCDKNFSTQTEKFVLSFFNKQFGATRSKHWINSISNHLEIGTEPFTKIACKELKMLATHDSRIHIIQFLFDVAASDDFINAKEIRCIQRIAGYLGLNEKDFTQMKKTAVAANNPYAVFGLEETATFEQVKSAYRKMILKFHPDKRGEERSEEEANLRFREVKRAFDTIKRTIG